MSLDELLRQELTEAKLQVSTVPEDQQNGELFTHPSTLNFTADFVVRVLDLIEKSPTLRVCQLATQCKLRCFSKTLPGLKSIAKCTGPLVEGSYPVMQPHCR